MSTIARSLSVRLLNAGVAAFLVASSVQAAPLNIEDVPLFLSSSVDPNVLINMSVETPMGGAAYTDQVGVPAGCTGRRNNVLSDNNADDIGSCYFPATEYLGYFNPKMCYVYDTGNNRFNPSTATTETHTCSSQWSGNFLNWMTMTAIDMFVMNMTGGNRTTDTSNRTVIRRARKQNNDSWFPRKVLNSTINVAPSTVTPFSDSTLYFHNTDHGFRVGTTFSSATSDSPNIGTYSSSVRVCNSAVGLEANCVKYGASTYKPEGLIQKNAVSKRFALISYTLDNSASRNGGVLRSTMKYVGPVLPDGSTNPRREYSASTGILIDNPEGAVGRNSGIINYINKFSDPGYKNYDPVGELFYEGLRYFKHIGRTPEYASGLTDAQYGGFQIITDWDDPIQYRCQKNFTVAINDANPWLDKKLPGTFFTTSSIVGAAGVTYNLADSDYGEPSNPDPAINVRTLTNRVGQLEGLNGVQWQNSGNWTSGTVSGRNDSIGGGVGTFDNSCTDKTVANLGEVMGTCPSPSKQNSYYVAGLAYYANTTDLRTDLANDRGKQTVESFFIDTQEFQSNPLDGSHNMLWLAGKYGGFKDLNDDGIPQTVEWDASGAADGSPDGSPDNYVLATVPQRLVDGLNQAFKFIDERTTTASAASVNSGSISSETRVYQATFNGDGWTGELLSYPVVTRSDAEDGDGNEGDLGAAEWQASQKLPAHGSRKIVTVNSDGTTKVPFRWNDLDDARKTQIDAGWTVAANLPRAQATLDYLRGDGSNEGTAGFKFRARTSKLGDIVSSSPIFVGAPRFSYRDNMEAKPYSEFRKDNADRTPVVYVGANDGMLHGFNAASGTAGGTELIGYVPSTAYANLRQLASPTYAHKYFVDGAPNVGDVYINNDWETVLIGGLNGGGQAIYALKITDPSTFSESGAGNPILWEFTDTDGASSGISGDPDLGYTYSQPAIVRLHTGKWAAVFGNGYNSTKTSTTDTSAGSGNAVLFVVDIETGKQIAKLDTKVGPSGDPTAASRPNGLATPAMVDIDGDAIVDFAYAGDLFGNMWKFDLRNANSSSWTISYGDATTPLPLFTATDEDGLAQPITSRPEVVRGRRGVGTMVLFGTGKYLESVDEVVDTDAPTVQTYYGLWDRNSGTASDRIADRTDLVEQTIDFEEELTIGGKQYEVRVTSQHPADERGWLLDLRSPHRYEAERQVSNSAIRAGRVIFTTLIPESDPCDYGGSSWLMELDALSGARLMTTPFDLNGDGEFTEEDFAVDGDLAGGSLPVSGIRPDVGITPEPGILLGEGGDKEFKYNPGTTGSISVTVENPGEGASGRQSWRQLR